MITKETLVKIMNRDTGRVFYKLPELGVTRRFAGKEVKEITFAELMALSYTEGGKRLLKEYLIIQDEEVANALLSGIEPEYFYTEREIKDLLVKGSLDAFLDCLDFAPKGVIDMIKDLSVDMELNDMNKRKAIFDKTGFDVTNAINIKNTKFDGGDEDKAETETKTRRVQPAAPAQTERRTTEPPKYNVISE